MWLLLGGFFRTPVGSRVTNLRLADFFLGRFSQIFCLIIFRRFFTISHATCAQHIMPYSMRAYFQNPSRDRGNHWSKNAANVTPQRTKKCERLDNWTLEFGQTFPKWRSERSVILKKVWYAFLKVLSQILWHLLYISYIINNTHCYIYYIRVYFQKPCPYVATRVANPHSFDPDPPTQLNNREVELWIRIQHF